MNSFSGGSLLVVVVDCRFQRLYVLRTGGLELLYAQLRAGIEQALLNLLQQGRDVSGRDFRQHQAQGCVQLV